MKDLATTPVSSETLRADIAHDAQTYAPTIAAFHRLWYSRGYTHGLTSYSGVPILKNPLDLWIYQELLWGLKPTLIIETGTAYGGSALFYADMLARTGQGHVVSIDIEPHDTLPTHPRISYVRGSSVDGRVVDAVKATASTHPRVMVILDSDHHRDHVLAELDAYADVVSPGQFLVVEDTNIDGRPVINGWNHGEPGPGAALDDWLPSHPDFRPDIVAERFLFTHYPGGWLQRKPA